MRDLYFDEKYGRSYEEMEKGTCEVFQFNHALGTIRHMFIKREIPIKMNGRIYYDTVTPYGYGGPLIEDCSPDNKKMLVEEFKEALSITAKSSTLSVNSSVSSRSSTTHKTFKIVTT